MKLVSRIKKVQEDLSSLKEQCRELLAAKQVLIFSIVMLLLLVWLINFDLRSGFENWEWHLNLSQELSKDWGLVRVSCISGT